MRVSARLAPSSSGTRTPWKRIIARDRARGLRLGKTHSALGPPRSKTARVFAALDWASHLVFCLVADGRWLKQGSSKVCARYTSRPLQRNLKRRCVSLCTYIPAHLGLLAPHGFPCDHCPSLISSEPQRAWQERRDASVAHHPVCVIRTVCRVCVITPARAGRHVASRVLPVHGPWQNADGGGRP